MIINPIDNKPFTQADADRILGLADSFIENWEEDDGEDAQGKADAAERRIEYDAIRPLLAAAPALYQHLAALTTMAENFWGMRDAPLVVESRKLVEEVRAAAPEVPTEEP